MIKSTLSAVVMLALSQGALADVVYSNDFTSSPMVASGVTAVFDAGAGSVVPTSAIYSGTYGNIFRSDSNSTFTQLTLSDLPNHTAVDINFLMVFLDSWDSRSGSPSPDNLDLYVDGNLFASYTYNNASGGDTDIGGGSVVAAYVQFDTHDFYSDTAVDMSADPGLQFAHTGSTLSIAFIASGAGWQAGADESWGIDNLSVSVTPVPEPSTYAMMLAGLGLVGTMARRRRN